MEVEVENGGGFSRRAQRMRRCRTFTEGHRGNGVGANLEPLAQGPQELRLWFLAKGRNFKFQTSRWRQKGAQSTTTLYTNGFKPQNARNMRKG